MKKTLSLLLSLILCGAFIVSAAAASYKGVGDIEIDTSVILHDYDGYYEDLGNCYWYEWEIDEEYGSGEVEFTIYYDSFDWQGEQYCESPADYPAMLDFLRQSHESYATVTDCEIDGYSSIIVECEDPSAEDYTAYIFICGDKYFYCIEIVFVEDSMTYDALIDAVKNMKLNGEQVVETSPVVSEDDENTQTDEEAVSGQVVKNHSFGVGLIIIAVAIVICCLIVVAGVVVIIIVKRKKH